MRIIEVHSCDECPYNNHIDDFCNYSEKTIIELCDRDGEIFPSKCELTDPAIPKYRMGNYD